MNQTLALKGSPGGRGGRGANPVLSRQVLDSRFMASAVGGLFWFMFLWMFISCTFSFFLFQRVSLFIYFKNSCLVCGCEREIGYWETFPMARCRVQICICCKPCVYRASLDDVSTQVCDRRAEENRNTSLTSCFLCCKCCLPFVPSGHNETYLYPCLSLASINL